jgi:hypothetical protein
VNTGGVEARETLLSNRRQEVSTIAHNRTVFDEKVFKFPFILGT